MSKVLCLTAVGGTFYGLYWSWHYWTKPWWVSQVFVSIFAIAWAASLYWAFLEFRPVLS